MSQLESLSMPGGYAPIQAAFRWWVSELLNLVPSVGGKGRLTGKAEIRLRQASVEIDRVRGLEGDRFVENRPLEELDQESWTQLRELLAGTRVSVLLGPPDVFLTRLTLPKIARRHLRSAVRLQVPQFAPLKEEALSWQCQLAGGRPDSVDVCVAMARTSRIEAILRLFEENDIHPPAIAADVEGQKIYLSQPAARTRVTVRLDRRLLAAGLLFVSIPLVTLASAAVMSSANEAEVTRLQVSLAPKTARIGQAARQQRLRERLQELVAVSSLTKTVEGLAAALPANAHVTRLERARDGRTTIEILTPDPEDVRTLTRQRPLGSAMKIIGELKGVDGSSEVIIETALQ